MSTRWASEGSTASGDEVCGVLADLVARGLVTAVAANAEAGAQVLTWSALLAELRRRLPSGGFAVSSVALRQLGAVNDIYGPATCDVLQEVLGRVVAAVLAEVEPGAAFAHAAGSQYLILHTGDLAAAERTLARIRAAVASTVLEWRGAAVHPRPVVSTLAVPSPAPYGADDMLKLLNRLRLEAERTDRGALMLRPGAAQDDRVSALRLHDEGVARVARALETAAVEVCFQPVMEVVGTGLRQVEVLARIRDGERLVPAAEFIDLVYDLGEIVELDSQVFRQVAARAEDLASLAHCLLVNVSPLSLTSPGFRAVMRESMKSIAARGIELVVVLELTEQALVDHLDFIRTVHAEHGVSFAVDDFGTGYSSLRTVTDLAAEGVITSLKVDGSLTRRLAESTETYKVLLAVANLARSLDLEVVAEHVESEAILRRLRTTGITLAQGNHLCPPLSLDELLARFAAQIPESGGGPLRGRLHVLEPYLEGAFRAFYDHLLAAPHLARFFRDNEQIADLMERQRASFLASLGEDAEALDARYRHLGHLHHDLGIPFPSFAKGSEILEQELLGVLASVTNDGALVSDTHGFFVRLRHAMAAGYLERLLEADAAMIAEAPLGCLRTIHLALATGGVPGTGLAADGCPGRELPPPLVARHRALHADAAVLAAFARNGEAAAVHECYLELRGRFLELWRAVDGQPDGPKHSR